MHRKERVQKKGKLVLIQKRIQQASALRGVEADPNSSLGDEKCGRRFCSKTEETMTARGVWSSLVSTLLGCALLCRARMAWGVTYPKPSGYVHKLT